MVNYQVVSCTNAGDLEYTIQEGSSVNWFAVQISNNNVGISKVEIQSANTTTYTTLTRLGKIITKFNLTII
jgi:expansin (peptidoglycan-binding protein)